MGEGFSVVTEELAQCGRRVSSMSSQAESLHGRATAAEVPARSWGLLGELTTHSKYADLQNQLTDHLSKMTAGLDNAGQRISNTADLYRETDEYHKKQIGDAGGDGGRDTGGVDPGRSGGPRQGAPVDGGPVKGTGDIGVGERSGGPGSGPTATGGPVAGGPIGAGPRGGLPPHMPVEHGGAPDPGTTPAPGDGHQNVHGQITVEVEGGGPVTVEVTGAAQEDVEVRGDIQQADGQTEHVDVHAQTDAAGHAKVSLKDPSHQHLSGTLLPNTSEEQA
jgi:uncharacterized protein YukE